MKKQLLTILTALCVGAMLMTTAAYAADDESGYTQQSTTTATEVSTADQLHAAVQNNGTVKLTADITIDKTLSITKENTLDLNGHVLKYENSIDYGSVIKVENGGNLTLEDSDQSTVHKFDRSGYPWVLAADDAEGDNITEVRGGVITGGTGNEYSNFSDTIYAGGGVCVAAGGTFTMNSGSIVGCQTILEFKKYGMGGGIFIYKDGVATMNGGTIAGCKADDNNSGGGVRNNGTFTMSGTALIEYCYGTYNGGGIYDCGKLTIEDDAVIRNCTTKYSTLNDAIRSEGSAAITGGVFYGNVYLYNANVQGGVFFGNINGGSTLQSSTVSFDAAGGDQTPQTQKVVGTGTKAIEPEEPYRNNYVFEGWYLGDTKYEFNTPVTEDITLVAKWNRICSVCKTSCPEECVTCGDGVAEILSPVDGADYHSGDVIPVRWKLCKKSVGDDAYVDISLIDADGIKTDLANNCSIDIGGANVVVPVLDKGGIYTFRVTVMRPDGETGTEVMHFDTVVFINGGNAVARDKTIDYADGLTFDVKDLFKFYDFCEVSTVKFTIDGGTGEGTLDGTTLNITKPGTFRIKATFTADESSGTIAGDVISTLTVNGCTVTFDSDGGSAVESRSMPVGGKVAEPTAPTLDGYIFDGWYLGDTKYDFETAVTSDITLTAKWIRDTSNDFIIIRSYSIISETPDNGDVTIDTDTALFGTTVAIIVTPDAGYVLETLTVTDSRGNELELTDEGDGKYSFVMPMSDVTVTATFMEDNTMLNYFVDVIESDYYYDAVLWAAREGITSGTDDIHFSPDQPCTRAQIVTFLWRAAGSPVVNYAMNFADVSEDAYYAEAVRWALSEGITTGTSGTTFSPDETCTRAQAVVFLYRYAAPDAVTLQELVSGYADADSVPEYAMSAMNWALYAGIVQGDGINLMPDSTCTRAQIVTFLYRTLG